MSASTLILDTNIVSYLMRGGALARAYQPHVQDHLLAISELLVGLKALLKNQKTRSYEEQVSSRLRCARARLGCLIGKGTPCGCSLWASNANCSPEIAGVSPALPLCANPRSRLEST